MVIVLSIAKHGKWYLMVVSILDSRKEKASVQWLQHLERDEDSNSRLAYRNELTSLAGSAGFTDEHVSRKTAASPKHD